MDTSHIQVCEYNAQISKKDGFWSFLYLLFIKREKAELRKCPKFLDVYASIYGNFLFQSRHSRDSNQEVRPLSRQQQQQQQQQQQHEGTLKRNMSSSKQVIF
jgi:hypothetical protein